MPHFDQSCKIIKKMMPFLSKNIKNDKKIDFFSKTW